MNDLGDLVSRGSRLQELSAIFAAGIARLRANLGPESKAESELTLNSLSLENSGETSLNVTRCGDRRGPQESEQARCYQHHAGSLRGQDFRACSIHASAQHQTARMAAKDDRYRNAGPSQMPLLSAQPADAAGVMTMLCLGPGGYVAYEQRKALDQKAAVVAIEELGSQIEYDQLREPVPRRYG